MLFAWSSALDRPRVLAEVAPNLKRRLVLEATTRLKPWGRSTKWMPTREALQMRAYAAAMAARREKAAVAQ